MLTAYAPSRHTIDGTAHLVAEAAQEDASHMDAHRRLTSSVADAITHAGFPRHFVPEHWRGSAGTFSSLLEEASAIAEVSASTAWCATLFAAHGRLAAYLPEQAQHDLWRESPDTRIAAAIAPPQGHAHPEPGGWRLTGQWRYASGVDVAEWVLLASWTPFGDGRQHRIFAVPRREIRVDDTWHALGLCATGSNTVTADDILVPSYRTLALDELLRPLPEAARCHRVPYPMVAALMFAMPALGAAKAALGLWLSDATRKRLPDGRLVLQRPDAEATLARSSADIEAAQHLLECAARRADGGPVSQLTASKARRDATIAAAMCAEATDRLFRISGAAGLDDSDPLQRTWRDVTAISRHAALNLGAAAAAYAQAVGDTYTGKTS